MQPKKHKTELKQRKSRQLNHFWIHFGPFLLANLKIATESIPQPLLVTGPTPMRTILHGILRLRVAYACLWICIFAPAQQPAKAIAGNPMDDPSIKKRWVQLLHCLHALQFPHFPLSHWLNCSHCDKNLSFVLDRLNNCYFRSYSQATVDYTHTNKYTKYTS